MSSVDIDADLVDTARTRLTAIGHRPRLRRADGFLGDPEAAPFDRIIATCSVESVPQSWAEQLAEAGILLVTLNPGPQAGTLAVLRRCGDVVEGRFVPRRVSFMPMRRPRSASPSPSVALAADPSEHLTPVPAQPWLDGPVAWFWTCLAVPGLQVAYVLDGDSSYCAVRFTAPDGSWTELPVGGVGERAATGAGSTPVLHVLEEAWHRWLTSGRPGWERVGLTITAERQWLWLDDPERGCRWELG